MVIGLEGIEHRLDKMRDELAILKTIKEVEEEEFKSDFRNYKVAERSFQIAIECCHDIANHLISALQMKRPDRYESVFTVLGEEGVIPKEFAKVMERMGRFRNLLVHEYLEIKSERVYEILQNNLSDFERFAKSIVEFMEKREG